MKPQERPCQRCDTLFLARTTQKYCSQLCAFPHSPTVERLCVTCQQPFLTNRQRKYCSDACAYERTTDLVGRLSTGVVGAIGELVVSADLMRRGYAVFRAVSPSCYSDLIAKKDGRVLEIEVRTMHRGRNGKPYFSRKLHADINCLALWDRATNHVTYLLGDPFTEMPL